MQPAKKCKGLFILFAGIKKSQADCLRALWIKSKNSEIVHWIQFATIEKIAVS